MAAKYWLKLYYEILDDPKMGRLRPAVKWRFIECLLVAGEQDADGFLPDTDELAWRVRADVEQLETDLLDLLHAGLLQKIDGRWYVTKFAERQSAVTGAERTARFRERQKKQEYYDSETQPSRNGNDAVTNRYTDTDKIRLDTDTDKIQNGGPYLPSDMATEALQEKWAEWLVYQAERGKPLTQSTANKQFQMLYQWGGERFIQAIDNSIANNWTALVEPKNGKGQQPAKPEPVYQSRVY